MAWPLHGCLLCVATWPPARLKNFARHQLCASRHRLCAHVAARRPGHTRAFCSSARAHARRTPSERSSWQPEPLRARAAGEHSAQRGADDGHGVQAAAAASAPARAAQAARVARAARAASAKRRRPSGRCRPLPRRAGGSARAGPGPHGRAARRPRPKPRARPRPKRTQTPARIGHRDGPHPDQPEGTPSTSSRPGRTPPAGAVVEVKDEDADGAGALGGGARRQRPRGRSADADGRFLSGLHQFECGKGAGTKVVPERIFSMTFVPVSNRLVVCAGDAVGHVGMWNVERNQGARRSALFPLLASPHQRRPARQMASRSWRLAAARAAWSLLPLPSDPSSFVVQARASGCAVVPFAR